LTVLIAHGVQAAVVRDVVRNILHGIVEEVIEERGRQMRRDLFTNAAKRLGLDNNPEITYDNFYNLPKEIQKKLDDERFTILSERDKEEIQNKNLVGCKEKKIEIICELFQLYLSDKGKLLLRMARNERLRKLLLDKIHEISK
jgi:hypothetical protein